MSREKADVAEFDVEAIFHVEVTADGAVHVSVQPSTQYTMMSRRYTRAEMKADPALGNDEWYGGGVAILDNNRAVNAKAMNALCAEAAREITAKVRRIPGEVSKP